MSTTGSTQILFIDSAVADAESILANLDPSIEVIFLNGDSDGLDQMASALEGRTDIDAIHVISHGATGYLELGNSVLDIKTMDAHADSLATIRAALSESADLLLYGCDVAAGDAGAAFISALAAATGADVAASVDTTGPALLGGDVVLEASTGTIEAAPLPEDAITVTLGADSQLPSGLASAPYTWNGITFQTKIDGEITDSDPENPLKAGNKWDRYVLSGVADGTIVKVYMGNSSTVDDYLQISRNGVVVTQNDDGGDGERSYDAFVSWTYQTGDVIHATTYSSGYRGTYSLYISTSTGTTPGATDIGNAPAPSPPPPTAPTFTDSYGLLTTYNDTGANDSFNSVSGTLTATDSTPNGMTFSGSATSAYGNLSVASGGQFTFTPIAAGINALGAGQSQTLTFAVRVTDGGGLYSTKNLSVTVVGANDAPTLAADAHLTSIQEDATVNNGASITSLFASKFSDVDTGQTLAGIVVTGNDANAGSEGSWQYYSGGAWHDVGAVSESAGLVLSAATLLRFVPVGDYNGAPGALTVHAVDSGYAGSFTNGASGVVFDTTSDATTSGVSVDSRTVSITVNAVNDAPIFVSAPGEATITETSAYDTDFSTPTSGSLSGTLVATDVESDASLLDFSIRGGTANAGVWTREGLYGTLTVDETTGAWSYEANKVVAINALPEGMTVTDNFEFKVTDPQGGFSTQNLVITVTGANDTPVWNSLITDQSFSGAGSWTYQVPAAAITDAEGTGLTYTVLVLPPDSGEPYAIGSSISGGPELASSWLTFDEATRTFSGNPPASWGDASINLRVTATDAEGAQVGGNFTLTLSGTANQPPVVDHPLSWQAVDGVNETTSVAFTDALGGTTITFDGETVTLGAAATGAEVATAVDAAFDADAGSGSPQAHYTADIKAGVGNENVVVLTATADGARGEFTEGATVNVDGGSYTVHVVTEGVDTVAEQASVQFRVLDGATSLTFDGQTIDITGLTASEIATAVAGSVNGNGVWDAVVDETFTDTVNFTARSTGVQTDLAASDFTVVASSLASSVSVSQQGSSLVLPSVSFNLVDGATGTTAKTFELVSDAGTLTVDLTGAISSANVRTLIQDAIDLDPSFQGNYTATYDNFVVTITGPAGDTFQSYSLTNQSDQEIDPSPAASAYAPAAPEVVDASFNAADGSTQITFDGVDIVLTGSETAVEVADAIFAATLPNWDVVNHGNGTLTLTAKVVGEVADLSAADFVNNSPLVNSVSVTQQGVDGVTEVVELSFDGSYGGATISLDGVDATAGSPVSAADVAAAVAGQVYPNHDVTDSGSGVVTITASEPGNQTDITAGDFGGTYDGTVTPNVTVQGSGWAYTIPANTFSDPEGDTLTYTAWTIDPSTGDATELVNSAALSFDANTGELTGDGSVPASTILEIRAFDAVSGGTAASQFQLVVYTDTQATSVVAGLLPAGAVLVDGEGSGSYTVPATAFNYLDTDAGGLTYSMTVLDGEGSPIATPAWLSFDSATGTFSGNPPDGAQDLSVEVTATVTATLGDEVPVSASTGAFTLGISAPNDALTLVTPMEDMSVAAGDPVSLVFAKPFSDPDGAADGTPTTDGITYTALANGEALENFGLSLTVNEFDQLVISGNPPGGVPYLNITITGTEQAGGTTATTSFTLDLADSNASGDYVGALSANNVGVVSISTDGTPQEGETISVVPPTDADGISGTVTYQWQVSADGTNWTDIAGARGQGTSLALAQSEAGQQVRVQAFYNDNGGTAESPVSDAVAVADLPDPGTITAVGSLVPGQTLSAVLADTDGLLTADPTYRWEVSTNGSSGWTAISGATYSTYTLTNGDGGKYFRVVTSYTDDMGNVDTNVTSVARGPVQLGAVAPVAVNDTNSLTEASGLDNAVAGTGPIAGQVLTNDTDANSGDILTVTSLRQGGAENAGVVAAQNGSEFTITGNYGSLVMQANGSYTYVVDEANAAVQALNPGESLVERFNYTVTDQTDLSDTAVLAITINGANDAPTVVDFPTDNTISEDTPTEVRGEPTLVDPDANTSLTMRLVVDRGTLRVTADDPSVTVTGSDTGTLTVSGTMAQVQNWLYSYLYQYVSAPNENQDVAPDPVLSMYLDDGLGERLAGVQTLHIEAVNDAPIVDANGSTGVGNDAEATFRPRGDAVEIAPSLTLSDTDSNTLSEATVTLASGAKDNQFGTFYETLGLSAEGQTALADAGLTVTVTQSTTGAVLTVSGTATVAEYQAVLRQVIYNNTNPNAFSGDRTVTVSVTDSDGQVSNAASFQTLEANAAIAVGQRIFIDGVDSGALVAEVLDDQHFVASTPLATLADGAALSFVDNTGEVTTAEAEGPLVSTVTVHVPWTPVIDMNGSGAGRDHMVGYIERAPSVAVATSDALITDQGGLIRSLTVNLDNPLDNDGGTVYEYLLAPSASVQSWLAARLITVSGNGTGTNGLTGATQLVFTASGAGSDATNFQVALRGVNYQNMDHAPDTTQRVVSVSSIDVDGNTGVDAQTLINLTAVNDAPEGTDGSVTLDEDGSHVFAVDDFGFGDPVDGGANALQSVLIASLPDSEAGTLTLDGVAVEVGQSVSAEDIAGGLLVFTPVGNLNGDAVASFTFQVRDDGGTANGGTDLDASANTLTINITPVNDAPVLGGDGVYTVEVNEDAVANPGETVATLINGAQFDVDFGEHAANNGTLQGMALSGVSASRGGAGHWEYQLSDDVDQNWVTVSLSEGDVLLLRSTDLLRFVPDELNGATGSLSFYGWDQSNGTAGDVLNNPERGGTTAFSTAAGLVDLVVTAVNDAPTLSGLDETSANLHVEGGAAVVIDADAALADVDFDAVLGGTGNWAGASLTVARDGGASSYDVFGPSGNLTLQEGEVTLSETIIGQYTQVDGVLTMVFNAFATQAGVNEVLNSLTYRHATGEGVDPLPASVTLRVTFNDQNSNGQAPEEIGTGQDQGTGGALSVSGLVTVEINRLPLPAADSAALDEGAATDSVSTVAGELIAGVSGADTDPDGDTLTVVSVGIGDTVVELTGEGPWDLAGMYGQLQVDANGAYTYVLDNTIGQVQALAVGESLSDVFSYTVDDGRGGQASSSLTVTIDGTNDAPVFSVIDSGDVADLTEAVDGGLTAQGSLQIADIDTTDSLDLQAEVVSVAQRDAGDQSVAVHASVPDSAALLAMLSWTQTAQDANTDQIDWSFNSGSHGFDYLAAGETLEVVYRIVGSDGNGGEDSQLVTLSIVGTNDAPVLVAETRAMDSVTEDDDGSTSTYLVSDLLNSRVSDSDAGALQGIAVHSLEGTGHGVWEYRLGNGAWTTVDTAELDNGHALLLGSDDAIRFVPDQQNGEDVSLSFYAWDQSDEATAGSYAVGLGDVGMRGGSTAYSTDSETITLTVTDVNDAPVIDINGGGAGIDGDVVFSPRGNAVALFDENLSLVDVDRADGVTSASLLIDANAALDNAFGTIYETLSSNAVDVLGLYTVSESGGVLQFSFDSGHLLTLSGNGAEQPMLVEGYGTSDEYTAVLRTIVYNNTNPNAFSGERPVTVVITDDSATAGGAGESSAPATLTVAVNWGPVTDLSGGSVGGRDLTVTYTEDDLAGVAIAASDAAVEDQDGNIASMHVALQSRPDGVLERLFVSSAQVSALNSIGITVSGNNTDALTLSAASPAGLDGTYFQLALRAIRYINDSQDPDTTQREVLVSSVDVDGNTGVDATTTINVVAVNDAPVIDPVADGQVDEAPDSTALINQSGLSGTLVATDVDSATPEDTDGVTFSIQGGYIDDSWTSYMVGSYGTLMVSVETGAYVYTPNADAINALSEGEAVTDVFTVLTTDLEGLSDSTTFTVNITGSNDAPTVSASAADAITEALDASAQDLSLSGTVDFADLDVNDSIGIAASYDDNIVWSGGVLTPEQIAALTDGTFVASAAGQAVPGSTGWSYDASGVNLDFLGEGESITFSYTVTATDAQGATATDTVSITINGSNDAPTVSASAADAIDEALDASAQDLSLSGTVDFADLDVNDSIGIAASYDDNIVWSGGVLTPEQIAALTDGTFVASAAGQAVPGSTGWSYDASGVNLDFLGEGESITFSYTVTATDAQGATATDTVSITINGSNDAPTVSASAADAIDEALDASAQDLSLSGTVDFADLDVNDSIGIAASYDDNIVWSGGVLTPEQIAALTDGTFVASAAGQAVPGSTGWSYDASGVNLDFLGEGESITFSYTVTATDAQGATATDTVSITINGSNDAPTVSASAADAIDEALDASAQDLSLSGTVDFADLDVNDSIGIAASYDDNIVWSGGVLTPEQIAALTDGTFVASAAGQAVPGSTGWSYDASGVNLDFLGEGESITFSYTVTATDAQGATATDTVSITINGSNDAPTVSASAADAIDEALDASAQDLSLSGTVDFADLDVNDSIGIAASYDDNIVWSGGELTPEQIAALTDGTFVASAAGQAVPGSTGWSYDASGVNLDFLGEGESITFSYTVTATDAQGATATDTVSITINGSNDGPTGVTLGRMVGGEMLPGGIDEIPYTAGNTLNPDWAWVGDLGSVDADTTDTHTYALVGGADVALFRIVNGNQLELAPNVPLDAEFKSSYEVQVRTTDSLGLTHDETLVVTINDVNEYAVSSVSFLVNNTFEGYEPNTVPEGVYPLEGQAATLIGVRAAATDHDDATNVVTYSLVGNSAGTVGYSAGEFSIDSATGEISVIHSIDYETGSPLRTIYVKATSQDGSVAISSLQLVIANVDEVAPTITSGGSASVNEGVVDGTVVYTATSTDTGDIAIGNTTYSLKADNGDDAASFTIDGATGAVSVVSSPDFEAKSSYQFTVVATDAAGNAREQVVTVLVNNLDEVAPSITSGAEANAIDENSGAGQLVYTVTSTDDADISAGVSYSLGGDDAAHFSIDEVTGEVFLLDDPDYETQSSYHFTVLADDGVNPPSEQAVSLTINNLDEPGSGSLVVTGTAQEGGELVASVEGLVDPDGTIASVVYQWQYNTGTDESPVWADLGGAGATLSIPSDQSYVGRSVRVVVTSTDSLGGTTVFTGTPQVIANVNDAPTGTVTISGLVAENQVLTAAHTIADADGMGVVSYQWLADGQVIDGATSATFTPVTAQIGRAISVQVTYVDGYGAHESVSSASTVPVAIGIELSGTGHEDVLTGTSGDDLLRGYAGADTLIGGAGSDRLWGDAGPDSMVGGLGDDFYVVGQAGDTVVELADEGIDTVNSYVDYTLPENVENLFLRGDSNIKGIGNGADNNIVGNAGNNVLNGLAGADTLNGGDGDDTLYAGSGDDRLYGGNGSDALQGGEGADTMAGGTGDDRYFVDNANDVVTELLDAGTDTVLSSISYVLTANVENLVLMGTDAIDGTGNALDNQINGNSGANLLMGYNGADVLIGAAGNDTLYGGNGNDQLLGGLDDDALYGEGGDDTLNGHVGDDVLQGGGGRDVLTGGVGADRFVYTLAGDSFLSTGMDVITDFSHAQGDKIDLSAVDVRPLVDGVQGFVFQESAPADGTNATGVLWFDNGVLYGSINANAAPEFAIELTGVTSLSASDLIL